jgi:TonB family protein
MSSSAKSIVLAVLCSSCFAQAAPHCISAALHDAITGAADAKMDGYALFRGEVSTLPQDLNQSAPQGGCCEGRDCISVQCSSPMTLPPFMVFEYSVNEVLWGDTSRPTVHSFYGAASACGSFKPVLHEKIITYCSFPEGGDDSSVWWCARPITDNRENLARVRMWIPEAIRAQQRVKVSEAEARTHLIHKVNPVLPKVYPAPSGDQLKGDVIVRIFISEAGTVRSIRAISGPSFVLRQAAINAVSLWRYKPFRAAGRPTKVDTTVTVHF